MSDQDWIDAIGAAHLVAAALLVWGLAGWRRAITARRGNLMVAAGALVAVVATLADPRIVDFAWIIAGTASGVILGAYLASRAGTTGAMPRAVVLLLASGGGAALLIALGELDGGAEEGVSADTAVPLAIAVVAGAAALAGALVVVGRLRSTDRSVGPPPGRRAIGLAGCAAALVLGALLVWSTQDEGFGDASVLALACLLALVGLALGGLVAVSGDDRLLPALAALLTGVAGLGVAADGVALESTAMIVAGGMVAAAGPTLARIMASAANRSLIEVLAGSGGARAGGAVEDARRRV